jgi:ferric-dicitrate binding protein FerR (iron transport regulator)
MYKKEKIKRLLRDYFEGKLSESERENLFYLMHHEDLEEAVFCEQYKIWEESQYGKKNIPSDKIFEGIKGEIKITDDKLKKGDLILKGIKYDQLHNRRSIINQCLRYAAIVVIATLVSGIVYFTISKSKTDDLALNEITVPYGSRISITLHDSSRVWVNSGSRLSYPSNFAGDKREVYLEGEAFFDIQKNHRQPFYVKTSDIDIKVLGTRFNVKSYPEEDIIETTLISGQLMLMPKQTEISYGKQTVLHADQKAFYSKDEKKLELRKQEYLKDIKPGLKKSSNLVNTKTIENIEHLTIETSWKDELLIFRDEPLSNLAKRLERWYGVEIILKDSEVGDFKYTGTIKNETIEQAMKALSVASSIDYSIDQNSIEISNKR